MKKKVGQVTPEEKIEIQQLFERRNGLNELAKILTPTTLNSTRNSSRTWARLAPSSRTGGIACRRSTNGNPLRTATGKSTLKLTKSIL